MEILNNIPFWIIIIIIFLLISYFFLIFFNLKYKKKKCKIKKKLENEEKFNKTINDLYDNVRSFKHDFDNIINTIGGYINFNDINGLKEYYTSLKKESINLKNTTLLNIDIINEPGIYNLLVSKYQKAIDNNININFEFFIDFKNIHLPIYVFTKIIGILIDNAIEASKKCDEKIVNILFRESQKNRVQIISIENTYIDKNIDINKMFDKGFSNKEGHLGIGLWEIKKIEKKYNNIILNISKDDKYFKQQLEIYY